MHQSRPFRSAAIGVVLFLLLAVGGCDPCFGVSTCERPRLDVYGDVLVHLNRRPAPGVGVVFVRTGGIEIDPDSQLVRTDSAGRFRVRATARGEGTVQGTLVFLPAPPFEGFVFSVPDLEMGTVRAAGESRFLGEWGVGPVPVAPYVSYAGELVLRGSGAPAAGVRVEYHRTGGVQLTPDPVVATSGSDGRFYLRADADRVGNAVGDLVIRSPSPLTVERVRLRATNIPGGQAFLGRWEVDGPLEETPAAHGAPSSGVRAVKRP